MVKTYTRFRKIKKYGNSWVIVLRKFDLNDLAIKEGDMIDLSDCIILSDKLYNIKMEEYKKNGDEQHIQTNKRN